MNIEIPGSEPFGLEHLVLDFNGTLAVDGTIIGGVPPRLAALAEHLQIHVITADTFGTARAALAGIPCTLDVLPAGLPQDTAKRDVVETLGAKTTAAIGNGRNDRLMVQAAALGVAVVQAEGAAVDTLLAADVAAPDILSALDLLARPQRLAATLRL
ncbi:MAG: ATPase P [Chloroflexi bacterium]|nr:MAG: ATPase P [Chloroflexota bacterium]